MDHEKRYPKPSIFKSWRHIKYIFKKPVSHPLETIFTKKNAAYLSDNGIMSAKAAAEASPRKAPNNLRGFHTNDHEKCIGCGTCGEICPTDAIRMVERLDVKDEPGKLRQRPVIDYGRCCFCALCVDTCTTGSLQMSKEYVYSSTNPDDFLWMPDKAWQGETVEAGYTKNETTDLLDLKRVEMDHVPPGERVGSFVEVVRGYSKETAKLEAARCVECGVCTSSCPVQMHIPHYIKAIWEDDIEGALRIVYETNPLPGVCGRVCTHNCENACAIAVRGEAIAIRWLKRYIIDSAPDDMYDKIFSEPVSEVIEAKVAVVGGGPSSLSAAYYLRGLGYHVDLFEERDRVGGVASYGAPQYRIPDYAVEKDVRFIEKIGVNIHLNTRVGTDVSFEELKTKYDAVFLGSGFFKARVLTIPGAAHPDCIGAMDFLPRVRDYARGVLTLDQMNVSPNVVVIGGGDVAFDVARNVTRIQMLKYGKASVTLTSLESRAILPASLDEFVEGSEEGVRFELGYGPQEVLQENGRVVGLRVVKCTSVFDAEKRFNPQFDKSEERVFQADQIYMSIGQAPDYTYMPEEFQKAIQIVRGKIKANEQGQVDGAPWLFVGGDVFRGPDIISGVADGHRAAQGIDDYLYAKSKKQAASDYAETIRNAIKFNTPVLTHKQRGR